MKQKYYGISKKQQFQIKQVKRILYWMSGIHKQGTMSESKKNTISSSFIVHRTLSVPLFISKKNLYCIWPKTYLLSTYKHKKTAKQ